MIYTFRWSDTIFTRIIILPRSGSTKIYLKQIAAEKIIVVLLFKRKHFTCVHDDVSKQTVD
jgi:hypothetical protein